MPPHILDHPPFLPASRRLTRLFRLLVGMMIGAIATLQTASAAQTLSNGQASKRILFIGSYHYGFQTFEDQQNGIRDALYAGSVRDTDFSVDVELMDSKRITGVDNINSFRDRLTAKLARLPDYDLIIVGDDNALQFAEDEQMGLFKDKPIVFLGINNVAYATSLQENPSITGVVEAASMIETLDLIESLYPNARDLYFLYDATPSGQGLKAQALASIESHGQFTFRSIDLGDMNFDELAVLLSSMPSDQPILFGSGYVDRDGNNRSFEESVAHAVRHANSPLFSLHNFGVGQGLIGGKVIDHYYQGLRAGQMALQILKGSQPDDIPIETESPNRYLFDYNALEQHGIRLSQLPWGSTIINRPVSLFEQRPLLVVSVSALILFLLMVSLAMGAFAHYRARANARLKHVLGERTLAMETAQQANLAKDRFLATMSHELRTPLNAILGYSQMIGLKTFGPINNDKYEEYIDLIQSSGEHLLDLISDVLEFSQFSLGEPGSAPYDRNALDDLMSQSIELATPTGSKADAKITCAPIPALGFACNKTQIIQILVNLLNNAIKYAKPETPARINISFQKTSEANNALDIIIADNGRGISADDLDRIFEPFFRGRDAFHHAVQGTGIGLSLCQQIAVTHDAALTAVSKLDHGSTFTLRLPADRLYPIA